MKDYRSYVHPTNRGDAASINRVLRLLEEGDIVAGISPEYQDPFKREITLMGTVAYCKYCPEWVMVPLVPNPGWASHCCDTILHRYVTRVRQSHEEWMEKIKQSRKR